jgi:hypothetical protein
MPIYNVIVSPRPIHPTKTKSAPLLPTSRRRLRTPLVITTSDPHEQSCSRSCERGLAGWITGPAPRDEGPEYESTEKRQARNKRAWQMKWGRGVREWRWTAAQHRRRMAGYREISRQSRLTAGCNMQPAHPPFSGLFLTFPAGTNSSFTSCNSSPFIKQILEVVVN